jgi:hypothetical protein
MTELLKTIIKNSYTTSEVRRRLRLVREYLEDRLFKGASLTIADFLAKQNTDPIDVTAIGEWGNEFWVNFTKENAYKVLDGLNLEVKKLPVYSLYIPYVPEGAEGAKLGKWFRDEIGPEVILDLHTDPMLLGGAAVVRQGMFFDYSIRYYLQQKRWEIEKIIGKYLEGKN